MEITYKSSSPAAWSGQSPRISARRPGRSPASWGYPGEIVVSGIHHDNLRTIGDNDALGVSVDVGILRAAKASIDDRQRLHVCRQRCPARDTRRTGEDDPSRRYRLRLIVLFKGPDGRFPILRERR